LEINDFTDTVLENENAGYLIKQNKFTNSIAIVFTQKTLNYVHSKKMLIKQKRRTVFSRTLTLLSDLYGMKLFGDLQQAAYII
jgi:hypothetical protein